MYTNEPTHTTISAHSKEDHAHGRHGNVDLNSRQFARLKREKKGVRALSSKRTSLRKKRQIVQKGGFVGVLLMPAIATLGSLLVNRMLSDS